MQTIPKKAKPIVKDVLYNAVGKLCNFDPRRNFVLFTDPRGGSTWLSEAINRIPKTVVLWEPLNIYKVDQVVKLGFANTNLQYIPELATWEEAYLFFEKLFKGRILSNYICQASNLSLLLERKNRAGQKVGLK